MNYNPRVVRNFWVELDVDGKKEQVGTGPSKKDGGFSMDVYIRKDGKVTHAVKITGYTAPNNFLGLHISTNQDLTSIRNGNKTTIATNR